MKKVTVENVKRIKKLKFEIPDQEGVYLLVGRNGAGKTTLLICLDRICNPRAFATGFSVSKRTPDIDQYKDASIQYETESSKVKFHKGNAKWMPTPKKGAGDVLRQMGYSETVFIKADSRRIDATQEEIAGGSFQSANLEIKGALNRIFGTQRYANLQQLKISHGRGTNPTFMYVMGKKDTGIYSEKRFSTGELAIIRLVESIQAINDYAMVLVDEAEMALHPSIQVELYKYLLEKAEQKHLTVFISTHSTTLIKAADKNHIMLLEDPEDDGKLQITYPCYPAKALGGVDYIDNSGFDVIFFVEDDMAKIYLDCALRRLRKEVQEIQTLSYAIFPVGGFYETGRIAIDTRERVFSGIKVFAVVDNDAFDDLTRKPKFAELIKTGTNKNYIKSLNITPEVWFCSQLETASTQVSYAIRDEFHFEINKLVNSTEYRNVHADNDRKKAKIKFKSIIEKCESSGNIGEDEAKRTIIKILVDDKPINELKQWLMPMVRK